MIIILSFIILQRMQDRKIYRNWYYLSVPKKEPFTKKANLESTRRAEIRLLQDISKKLDYLIALHREEDLRFPHHPRSFK